MTNENKNFLKNDIVKDANIKELTEEPKEIKIPNWIDKNKFEKILAIIDSKKSNYKNKIGEFKYIDIKDLVNNIKNNTISETDAKKDLNTLNEIKNAEIIKYKKRTPGHKELLNLFDDLLDIIVTDKYQNQKVKKTKIKMKMKNLKVEKKKMKMKIKTKTFCQSIQKMLMIICLKNTVEVKILILL